MFINIFNKYRFFYLFVIIGFTSIVFEILVLNLLRNFNISVNLSIFLSLLVGILFAFYFNFFFNFEIHKSKLIRAFLYFITISLLSWTFQKIISSLFQSYNYPYEIKRLVTSGFFFIIAYLLHRKFSFKDYKKVGIAFYLSENLNINKVYKLIKNNTNFIHIDIVDKSFSKSTIINNLNLLPVIKKKWPNQEIQFHIMSKYPTKWVKKLIKYSDVIYVHIECHEDIERLKKYVLNKKKKFGIATTLKTKPSKIKKILNNCSHLLILSVDRPGFSGQRFNTKAFQYINYFNAIPSRNKFRICVDGGVNKNIVRILDVDDVVSNSSILGSKEPINEINNLKLSDL